MTSKFWRDSGSLSSSLYTGRQKNTLLAAWLENILHGNFLLTNLDIHISPVSLISDCATPLVRYGLGVLWLVGPTRYTPRFRCRDLRKISSEQRWKRTVPFCLFNRHFKGFRVRFKRAVEKGCREYYLPHVQTSLRLLKRGNNCVSSRRKSKLMMYLHPNYKEPYRTRYLKFT